MGKSGKSYQNLLPMLHESNIRTTISINCLYKNQSFSANLPVLPSWIRWTCRSEFFQTCPQDNNCCQALPAKERKTRSCKMLTLKWYNFQLRRAINLEGTATIMTLMSAIFVTYKFCITLLDLLAHNSPKHAWGHRPCSFHPGTRFLNSLCIFKTMVFRVTQLGSYFNFYSLYNIWKDQLYRISRLKFYEWLFGPVKFLGLLGNARLASNSTTE